MKALAQCLLLNYSKHNTGNHLLGIFYIDRDDGMTVHLEDIMSNAIDFEQQDKEYIANTYGRFNVCFEKGKGSLLWDVDGKVHRPWFWYWRNRFWR